MTMLRGLLSAVLLFEGVHLHAQDIPPDVRKAACAHMVEAVQSVVEARDAGVSKSKMLEEVTGQSGKSQPSGADKDKLRFLVAFAYNSRTAGDADDRSLTWSISPGSTGSAEVSKSTGTRQYERSESYVPHPIGASARQLECASNRALGSYFAEGQPEEKVWVSEEPRTSTWTITLQGSLADVRLRRTDGHADQKWYNVEKTVAGNGYILTSARDPGVSPETITISLTRGTFVYSSQHVNPTMNRANIYIGHCRALGGRAP
jgi:hypothetical protein